MSYKKRPKTENLNNFLHVTKNGTIYGYVTSQNVSTRG